MKNRSTVLAAALFAVFSITASLPAAGPAGAAETNYEEASRLTREAFAADEEGRHGEATELVRRALAIRPNHPGLLFVGAQTAAGAGDKPSALAFLGQIADMGLSVNLAAAEALAPYAIDAAFQVLAARIEDNAKAKGAAVTRTVADETLLLVEGTALDETTGRFFLSSIFDRRLVVMDRSGKVLDFADRGTGLLSPTGLKIDAVGSRLIVASAATPQTPGLEEGEEGKSAILAFNLATGDLLQSWQAGDGKHWFGDITLGPNGVIYISDSLKPELLSIAPGTRDISTLVAHPDFVSPQGLALSDDGATLYLADYAMGLFHIDLATRAVTPMAPSSDLAPYGIDGLYFYKGDLIAIQNGVRPQRVIRVNLQENGRGIESSDILLAAHPDFPEPTLGTISRDSLFFVANAAWPHFGKLPEDPEALRTEPPATVILEVSLVKD